MYMYTKNTCVYCVCEEVHIHVYARTRTNIHIYSSKSFDEINPMYNDQIVARKPGDVDGEKEGQESEPW